MNEQAKAGPNTHRAVRAPVGVVATVLFLALSWMIAGQPTPAPTSAVDTGSSVEVDVAIFGVG